MTETRRFADLDGRDAYDVLGVPPEASAEQIRRAYRAAMRTAHPDMGGAEAHAKLLNCAMAILADHRAEYDGLRGPDPGDRIGTDDMDGGDETAGGADGATPRPGSDPWGRAAAGFDGLRDPSGPVDGDPGRRDEPSDDADGPTPRPEPDPWNEAAEGLAGLRQPHGRVDDESLGALDRMVARTWATAILAACDEGSATGSDPAELGKELYRYRYFGTHGGDFVLWASLSAPFGLFTYLAAGEDGATGLMVLFGLAFGCLLTAALRSLSLAARRLGINVKLYEGGMVTTASWGAYTVIPWRCIESVRIVDGAGDAAATARRFELQIVDGSVVRLPAHLLQSVQLGLVVEMVVTGLLLTETWALLLAGERVSFGPLQIDRDHLWHGRGSRLSWCEITELGVTAGTLYVVADRVVPGDYLWPTREVLNLSLLVQLGAALAGGDRRG